MSFISQYVTPFFDFYHRALEGNYLATQLQFKGSVGQAGGDYGSKVNRYNQRKITSVYIFSKQSYEESLQRVKQPSFAGFFEDNISRLLLNPFDRLIAAYQAYPSLKARFSKPGTFSHTFTEIMNQGAFLGAFKGVIFNLAQFGFVLYPSVVFANRNNSDSKFVTFLSSYTFFDALFYPVDSLKNILYADTLGSYSIKSVANSVYFRDLYRGIALKLAYNVPVLSGLYCTTQTGKELEATLSWILAGLFYPLNTLKVRNQVCASGISSMNSNTSVISHSLYRGVVPYLLLNILVGYSLRPLFSQEKLSEIEQQMKHRLKQGHFA